MLNESRLKNMDKLLEDLASLPDDETSKLKEFLDTKVIQAMEEERKHHEMWFDPIEVDCVKALFVHEIARDLIVTADQVVDPERALEMKYGDPRIQTSPSEVLWERLEGLECPKASESCGKSWQNLKSSHPFKNLEIPADHPWKIDPQFYKQLPRGIDTSVGDHFQKLMGILLERGLG
jgi:hypothetical protein